MNKSSSQVAVVGASGYAGEELVRLLLSHPHADLVAVTSRQLAGRTLAEAFPRFGHHKTAQSLKFIEFEARALVKEADLIFLALPHGVSTEVGKELFDLEARLVDLSADFRLRAPDVYKEFYGKDHGAPELLSKAVYGLPEIYREKIRDARLVASPGCYPTSILLPLLPLLRAKAIDEKRIVVTSLSGVTGAGRKVEADYLFAECNENLRAYGLPKHRHLSEIEQELSSAAGKKITIQFTPHLVPVNRGILTTIFLDQVEGDGEKIGSIYEGVYAKEPFVRLLGYRLPETKDVTNTNFIDIGWKFDDRTRRLIVVSAIDNLTKGTSGQAIQCFNLMCGFEETAGLI